MREIRVNRLQVFFSVLWVSLARDFPQKSLLFFQKISLETHLGRDMIGRERTEPGSDDQEIGFGSLWRGNTANVIRYFPTQKRTESSETQEEEAVEVEADSTDGVVLIWKKNYGPRVLKSLGISATIYKAGYEATRSCTCLSIVIRKNSLVYDFMNCLSSMMGSDFQMNN
ncbi:hypothetical protein C5167_001978 [Papaver somniferum]|uniref:Uncharacterized protein n=1 Tax=Papaver somniferum TaxID=3469 RepID=A0A4Y7KV48_PAPSO|nr:hypothetical protein C5167_001978 [Papaver somniferum]